MSGSLKRRDRLVQICLPQEQQCKTDVANMPPPRGTRTSLSSQEVGKHGEVIAAAEPLLVACPDAPDAPDIATSLALAYRDRAALSMAAGRVLDSCGDLEASLLLLCRSVQGGLRRRVGSM